MENQYREMVVFPTDYEIGTLLEDTNVDVSNLSDDTIYFLGALVKTIHENQKRFVISDIQMIYRIAVHVYAEASTSPQFSIANFIEKWNQIRFIAFSIRNHLHDNGFDEDAAIDIAIDESSNALIRAFTNGENELELMKLADEKRLWQRK